MTRPSDSFNREKSWLAERDFDPKVWSPRMLAELRKSGLLERRKWWHWINRQWWRLRW